MDPRFPRPIRLGAAGIAGAALALLASWIAWGGSLPLEAPVLRHRIAAEAADEARFYPLRYYPGTADSALSQAIEMAAGETSANLVLPMDAGGGSISGRVLGQSGTSQVPLGGLLVTAILGRQRVLTRSESDGGFTLHGIPAGAVRIRYSSDDPLSREVHYQALYHPGVPDAAQADQITVGEGEQIHLDPVLLPPGAVVGGAVLAGDSGSPLAGVEVRVFSRLAVARPWAVRTSSEGRFLQGGLSGGEYLIEALPSGTEYIAEFYGGAREIDQAGAIQLHPGEPVLDLSLPLDRGGSIWGQLRREDHTGLVGLEVQATETQSGAVFTTTSYEYGHYRIQAVPTGSYRVYVPALRLYYPDARVEREARPVRVTEPGDVFDIDFTGSPLDGCQLPEILQGAISGYIRGDLSQAGRIVLRVFSETDTIDQEIQFPGAYTVGCIRAGTYKVGLFADGPVVAQYYSLTPLVEEARLVSVTAEDTVQGIDFRVEGGVRLEGEVRDRLSGSPLPGVRVRAVELISRVSAGAVADSLGRFLLDRVDLGPVPQVHTGLPSGRWRVEAESTLVPPPSLTPVLTPSLAAHAIEPEGISLEWWLNPEVPWCYLLKRFEAEQFPEDPAGQLAGGESIREARRPAQGSDGVEVLLDYPPGEGPYRYLLLAWTTPGDCGAPSLDSIFRATSAPVRPSGPVGPVFEPRTLQCRVSPTPWKGRGNLLFRASQPLPAGARLKIFSAAGVEVAALRWPAGDSELPWAGRTASGRTLPSGLYLWSLRDWGGGAIGGSLLVIR